MLSKDELIKKKAKASQLDLVETIEDDNRDIKKRNLLLLSLFLTVGLSFIFWTYRQLSSVSFNFALPKARLFLPQSIPTQVFPDEQVSQILKNKNLLSDVYLGIYPQPKTVFNWSGNKTQYTLENLNSVYQSLVALKPSPSIISKLIPTGLIVKEKLSESTEGIRLESLIITPDKQILLVLKTISNDKISFQKVLNELVPLLYWSAIKSV